MKRKLGVYLLALCCATPVWATSSVSINIDNHKISTTSYTYGDNLQGKYFMDVTPEVKNGRTFVPISTIGKFLGGNAKWDSPSATISLDETEIILNIGMSTALKNGESIQLDAAPFIKNGRTMVPVRFISEAFGYTVNYVPQQVHITTPATEINGNLVDSIQCEIRMTNEVHNRISKNNTFIRRIFDLLNTTNLSEVEGPAEGLSGPHINIDVPSFYYLYEGYSFMNSEGSTLKQCEIYYEYSYAVPTGNYLLKDTLNNKWYTFSQEKTNEIQDIKTVDCWEK